MRRVTSMNAYLCALALSDALIVITAVLLYSLTTIECVHPIVSNVHSRLALIAFPLSTFAQTFSVYMTMAAAVDCCISTLASNQTRYGSILIDKLYFLPIVAAPIRIAISANTYVRNRLHISSSLSS
jgi:hypothetical protein